MGRRYFWRVRACEAASCGPWSSTRYVDVGRIAQDFNGDGFGDIVSAVTQPPAALVFAGATSIDASTPTARLDAARSVPAESIVTRWVGDVNADGFGDLAVGQPGGDGLNGRVRVFFGGAQLAEPPLVLDGPTGFGGAVASGDFDGDGHRDLVVCGPTTTAFMGPDLVRRVTLDTPAGYGSGATPSCDGIGDVDDDGFDDVIVGGLVAKDGSTAGAALYSGGVAVVSGWAPSLVVRGAPPATGPAAGVTTSGGRRGFALAMNNRAAGPTEPSHGVGIFFPMPRTAGTVDAAAIWISIPDLAVAGRDGGSSFGKSLGPWFPRFGDVPILVAGAPGANRVFLYQVNETDATLMGAYGGGQDGVFPQTGNALGFPGDANGDGFGDMVVGNPFSEMDGSGAGSAYFFPGGATLPQTHSVTFSGTGVGLGIGSSVD